MAEKERPLVQVKLASLTAETTDSLRFAVKGAKCQFVQHNGDGTTTVRFEDGDFHPSLHGREITVSSSFNVWLEI